MTATEDLTYLVGTYWSLFLGNIVEWYEFACYGYLSIYLEKPMFAGSRIGVWLGFAVTFLARPLGGTVLGLLGDTIGRSAAVNLSLIGMLIGTCGQGLLPTFDDGDTWGKIGLVSLVVLRFIQGLSAAGEISTISAYITEVSPHRTLGRSISLIAITANLGFLSAKGVVFLTHAILGSEDMKGWGWRLPFLFALIPGLTAIAGRRHLPESEAWSTEQEKGGCKKQRGSIPGQVFGSYWRNILVGAGGVASYAIVQYGGFIWMQGFLAHQGMSSGNRMQIALVSRVLMILLGLPVGWLADIKGVGWVTLVGSALIACVSLPLFALISGSPTNLMVVMGAVSIGFSLAAVLCGTVIFLFVVELFPTAVRGLGSGISYNLGFSLFGGLAPLIAEASLGVTPYGPGILLMAGGLITLLSVLAGLAMERRGLMKMAHVRPTPYLGAGVACDDSTNDESSDSASENETSTDQESSLGGS